MAKYKYTCTVCGKPNNYWWMYCQEHEAQCDREMDEADDPAYEPIPDPPEPDW